MESEKNSYKRYNKDELLSINRILMTYETLLLERVRVFVSLGP